MSDKKTAMEVASRYLENRMRTVAEVRKKLQEKEFSDEEISETINELIGLRYLDDYEYAKRYYAYSVEKRRGSLRAMRELEEKGVDKETIKFAYEDFVYETKVDELAIAKQVAKAMLNADAEDYDSENREPFNEKMRGKIARKLETRGFSTSIIIRILNEM